MSCRASMGSCKQRVYKFPMFAGSYLQLGTRLQQMASHSSTVLFDFERHNAFQFQHIRQALHESIGRGKTQPLRPLMHRWVGLQCASCLLLEECC